MLYLSKVTNAIVLQRRMMKLRYRKSLNRTFTLYFFPFLSYLSGIEARIAMCSNTLPISTNPLSRKIMTNKLILNSLKCKETEDWGKDECRLEINGDGVRKASLKKSMNDGDTWRLDRSYTFNNSATIKLWDEDSPDSDDFLGSVLLDTRVRNDATARFTRDGADYTLSYRVEKVSTPEPVRKPIKRVVIQLLDVHCRDTEDVTGADEFYLIGSVIDSKSNSGKPILTSPVSVNDGETKSLKGQGSFVFDGSVDENTIILLEMAAYDEDYAKDWDKYDEYVLKIGGAISSGLAATANPISSGIGAGLGFALKGFDAIAKTDKDDELGSMSDRIRVKDLRPGSTIRTWKFKGGSSWWSSWEHIIRYQVTAET